MLNYFMKVFILEYYRTWVIKNIPALLKFHLYKKSWKFLAFICIKIESKFFRVAFKALFNTNLFLFLAYYQLIPWDVLSFPWPLTTECPPFLCFFSCFFCLDCPLSSFPFTCLPVITRHSQQLPPLKCPDRSSYWTLSLPSTHYIPVAKPSAVSSSIIEANIWLSF